MNIICNACKQKIGDIEREVTIENAGSFVHHKDYCEGCKQ